MNTKFAKQAKGNNESNGMILSPLGNMYYMPNQENPASHDGDILKLHCKAAWSDYSEDLYWPTEMHIQHFNEVTPISGVILLSYTKENYIFPKIMERVKVEIREEPFKWILNFKNLGEIVYIPEHGIAFIQGGSITGVKSIYKAIYNMYESHCTIVKESRPQADSMNLDDLFE